MKLVGLSYNDQIWSYGLSLYRFSQTRDESNLTMDERVLRRLIAIGLYDNDAFQNSLHWGQTPIYPGDTLRTH